MCCRNKDTIKQGKTYLIENKPLFPFLVLFEYKNNHIKDFHFIKKIPIIRKVMPLLTMCRLHHKTNALHLEVVDVAIIFRMNKTNKNKKGNLVKSNGRKRHLSQFCTFKQNQLPSACLRAEGEGSTQKQCNYSALAQQQRAKRASKAFL